MIRDIVREILAKMTGEADFDDNIELGGKPYEQRGLCLDSLDRVEFVVQLEHAFDIDIPDRDFMPEEMRTPAGVIAYLEQRLGAERFAA